MYNPYFKRNNIIRFYTRTIVNTANLSISITTTTLVETMNIFLEFITRWFDWVIRDS